METGSPLFGTLCDAVKGGDRELVKELLLIGTDVCCKDQVRTLIPLKLRGHYSFFFVRMLCSMLHCMRA